MLGIPNLSARLMQYETGRMTEEEQVEFFQDLITSGLAWQLQGHYGRTAATLLSNGLCKLPVALKA